MLGMVLVGLEIVKLDDGIGLRLRFNSVNNRLNLLLIFVSAETFSDTD